MYHSEATSDLRVACRHTGLYMLHLRSLLPALDAHTRSTNTHRVAAAFNLVKNHHVMGGWRVVPIPIRSEPIAPD